ARPGGSALASRRLARQPLPGAGGLARWSEVGSSHAETARVLRSTVIYVSYITEQAFSSSRASTQLIAARRARQGGRPARLLTPIWPNQLARSSAIHRAR